MANNNLSNISFFFSFKNHNRERKQREVYLESMKKEAEQKKQQAERIDRRAVNKIFIFWIHRLINGTHRSNIMNNDSMNYKTISPVLFLFVKC